MPPPDGQKAVQRKPLSGARDASRERQALHARRLAFDHPVDGRPLEFEAPLPADFTQLVKRLRRQG